MSSEMGTSKDVWADDYVTPEGGDRCPAKYGSKFQCKHHVGHAGLHWACGGNLEWNDAESPASKLPSAPSPAGETASEPWDGHNYIAPEEGHGRWGCRICGYAIDWHRAPIAAECPNCGAKGDERCHDTEGPPARFVSRHKSRPRLGDSAYLLWEYQGDGLILYWQNPYNNGAKEIVAMMMWPTHAPEKTEEIEQLYERMASTFVTAWNGSAPEAVAAPIAPAAVSETEKQNLWMQAEEFTEFPDEGTRNDWLFVHREPRIGWAYLCRHYIKKYLLALRGIESVPSQRPSAEGDGWIAVTEGLPEVRDYVLAVDSRDGDVGIFLYVRRGFVRSPGGCVEKVTHWRLLPAPPSGQGEVK